MDNLSDQAIQRLSELLTTEHFTLQGARNATITEANGRLGHYISIVGSSVVAQVVAFVVQILYARRLWEQSAGEELDVRFPFCGSLVALVKRIDCGLP